MNSNWQMRIFFKLILLTLCRTLVTPFQPQSLSLYKGGHHHIKSTTSQFNSMSTDAPSTPSSLSHIKGIEDIADSYSTFLLDMWGVMHNGSETYDGVINTIKQLKSKDKKLIILSNSSKRIDSSIKMLTKLGFDPHNDFHQIITSGDVSYRMLSGDTTLKCSTWNVLQDLIVNNQKKVFVFGSGDNDEEYCESAGWRLSSIDEADLIIARGTFTINDGSNAIVSKKDNGENEYFKVMNEKLDVASKRNLPMLVTNPDKVRPDEGLPPMPGAIGDAYEEYLKNAGVEDSAVLVKRIGKPYAEVYEMALDSCDDSSSAIMVGDALETDITGGNWSKVDTLWVIDDGIHAPFVNEQTKESYEESVKAVLDEFNEKKGYSGVNELKPSFITRHFKW